jgi:hypothetical protein
MKLVRYGAPGAERPGIWLEADREEPARIVDVRAMVFDIEDYDARFWRTFGVERLRGLLQEEALKTVPADGVRLGPPVAPRARSSAWARTTATTPRSSTPRCRSSPSTFPRAPDRCAVRPIRSACAPAGPGWMPRLNSRW